MLLYHGSFLYYPFKDLVHDPLPPKAHIYKMKECQRKLQANLQVLDFDQITRVVCYDMVTMHSLDGSFTTKWWQLGHQPSIHAQQEIALAPSASVIPTLPMCASKHLRVKKTLSSTVGSKS